MEKSIGFIVLRHVTNKITDKYWKHCITQIQNFYPESKIMLIDDNSDQSFVSQCLFENVTVIQSEYPGRGELLPYIYYLRNGFCDCAVIIHDSVFIQRYVDFYTEKIQPLWTFDHNAGIEEQFEDICDILNKYDHDLVKFYKKSDCLGIFGGMTVVSHDFLKQLDMTHRFSTLINSIKCRYNRCSFERVLGFLCELCIDVDDSKKCGMFGDICKYCEWGIKFEDKHKYQHLPILKVWTGR